MFPSNGTIPAPRCSSFPIALVRRARRLDRRNRDLLIGKGGRTVISDDDYGKESSSTRDRFYVRPSMVFLQLDTFERDFA